MIMEEDLRMRTTLELRGYKLCMRVGKMEGLTEREQEDRINMILDLYQLYGNNVINLLGECIGIRWEGKPKRKSKKKKNSKKKLKKDLDMSKNLCIFATLTKRKETFRKK